MKAPVGTFLDGCQEAMVAAKVANMQQGERTDLQQICRKSQPEAAHPDDESILDGRNRYPACLEAEVEPDFIYWDGKGDPVSYVISKNLHRRHLDENQRGMVADKIANMKRGERTDLAPIGAKFSQAEAAKMLNVGERTVERAAKVRKRGTPELVQAVEQGNLAVSVAAQVADLPQEEQAELLTQPRTDTGHNIPLPEQGTKVINTAG
jgi:hypothetical protein